MNILDREFADFLDIEYRRRGSRLCQARLEGKRCLKQAKRQEGRWWFCLKHAAMWETHNRIVDRILEIPCRD